MDKTIQRKAESYFKKKKRKQVWKRVVSCLAAVIVFCTTYALILPAITKEQTTYCGMEEHIAHEDSCYSEQTISEAEGHIHTDACYAERPILICGQEEHAGHIHNESCYEERTTLSCDFADEEEHTHTEACFDDDGNLICGLNEHIHDDSCYTTEKVLTCTIPEQEPHYHDASCYTINRVLVCGKEEYEPSKDVEKVLTCELPLHKHTLQCYSNPEADIETASAWEKTFSRVKLSGNWNDDVLSIAKTQLGYSESEANYFVEADGTTKKGYTRYGAWYGVPYGDWCAMFCSFCIRYANVGQKWMPLDSACPHWIETLSDPEFDLYFRSDEYIPVPGDLIFFDWDSVTKIDERSADHVGFVAELIYDEESNELTRIRTIEGNSGNCVQYVEYAFDDARIMGYGKLPQPVSAEARWDNGILTLEATCHAEGSYSWQWLVSENGTDWEEIPGATELSYHMDADASALDLYYRIRAVSTQEMRKVSLLKAQTKSVSGAVEEYLSVPVQPSGMMAVASSSTTKLLVTASDFQDPDTSYTGFNRSGNYTAQVTRIKNIMQTIKDSCGNAYGFIAGGDYGFDSDLPADKTRTGVNAIRNAVTEKFGSDTNMIFIQGNHDAAISDFASTGAHDTDYYGVYVINEDNYPSKPGSGAESVVQSVATQLNSYLLEKKNNSYNHPVFICTHVPLHYSTRTKADGDAMYADTLFNVINSYGNDLNIIFLYGHDHAWGDDDHLGGASVYLTRGDSINIALHGNKNSYSIQTLNFTYMNYGFTGYYWAKWGNNYNDVRYSNADSTLTMSSFAITGNDVIICRWEENGQHATLKSIGKASQGYRGVQETCPVTTNTYGSPQTVGHPSGAASGESESELVPGSGKVLSNWDQLERAERIVEGTERRLVASAIENDLGISHSFQLFDIQMCDGAELPAGGVELYLPAACESSVFSYGSNGLEWFDDAEFVTLEGQTYMRITATHFSLYGTLGSELQEVPEIQFQFPNMTEPSQTYWMRCTAVSDFVVGETYMIVSQNGYALGMVNHAKTSVSAAFTEAMQENGKTYYTVSSNASGDAYQFTLANGNNGNLRILCVTDQSYGLRFDTEPLINTSPSYSMLIEAGVNGGWRIRRNNNNQWLNCDNNGTFARYSSSQNPPATTTMTIYKKYEAPGRTYDGMLAVQKNVTEFNTLVDDHTPFSFRLTKSTTDSYADALPITGDYELFAADGSLEETGTLTDNGIFTLQAGQTALFDVPPTGYYYVAEAISTDIEQVLADVNEESATVTEDSDYNWVSASFQNGQSLVCFNNTPLNDSSYLDIHLMTVGANENVTDESEFVITVLDDESENAVYSYYQRYDADNLPIGTLTDYDEEDPSIVLHPGEYVRLYDLEQGTYTIHQELGSSAPYVCDTTATVNEISADVTGIEEDDLVTETVLELTHSGRTYVELIDRLEGVYKITFDYGDGTFAQVYTDVEGHITTPWPQKQRAGMEFSEWRTRPYLEGQPIPASSQSVYTFTKDTTLYAHWLPFTVHFESDAQISKDLRESTAYDDDENPENVFDIDLNVSLPSTGDQAIVLVFDLSSSMDVQCAVCGGLHDPATHNNLGASETHDTYYQGETYNGVVQGQETTVYCSQFSKRLPIAKEQADAFIHQLKASLDDGQNCYIEIIGFAKKAWEILPATNLAAAGGEATIINKIDSMAADSGTNIASGLKMGYEKLTQIVSANNIDRNNSYVILLSDGAPTTNDTTMQNGYSNPNSEYYLNAEDALATSYIDKWKDIWSQYDHYRWNDSGFDHSVTNAKYYNIRQVMATPYYADMIRDYGAKLYSVAFGVNMDFGYWKGANNFKYVGGIGIDNFDYVTSFSDAAQFAITGSDLASFYNSVIGSITVTCSDAVVTDPMSDNVEFICFTDANGTDIGNVVYDGDHSVIASYDPATRKITWNPDMTDAISYKVRLKNEMTAFEDWEVSNKAYLTNGITTFDYKIKVGNNPIESKHKTTDIPHVHGWLGEFSFTKIGGFTQEDSEPLPGAIFTLTHDAARCPVCSSLTTAQHGDICAQINTTQTTSDDDGFVSFDSIPSGHSYILHELSPPQDYEAIEDYIITVSYDEVSIQPTGSNVYWDADQAQMWNPYVATYELPETGGTGVAPLYALGAALCMLAIVYGFSMRRKRERRSVR